MLVDMVLHEVTRQRTPTSAKISDWAQSNRLPVMPTRVFVQTGQATETGSPPPAKNKLGERAIQEALLELGLNAPETVGVFLFEDHKIARRSFLVPENCRKVSTRAYLQFLERRGLIESAAEVERRAIAAGRSFSMLRFPA